MPAHFRYHVPEIVFNAFVSEMRRRCARELTSEKNLARVCSAHAGEREPLQNVFARVRLIAQKFRAIISVLGCAHAGKSASLLPPLPVKLIPVCTETRDGRTGNIVRP
jgi:hypothetical protein